MHNPKVKKYPTFLRKEGDFRSQIGVPARVVRSRWLKSLGDLICCLFWRLSVLGLERWVWGVYGEFYWTMEVSHY